MLFIISTLVPVQATFALAVKCQCVLALRELKGVYIRGDAVTLKPNVPLNAAIKGDVLLLRYGKVSHAALITDIIDVVPHEPPYDRVVTGFVIDEYNYIPCAESVRTIGLENVVGVYRPGLEK